MKINTPDYRCTKCGTRRFKNSKIYRLTWLWQSLLRKIGIAWHNSYSDECTNDFSCCNKDIGKNVWLRIGHFNRYF